MLSKLNITDRQKNLAILTILGRLIQPTSERGALYWAKNLSGLGELIGSDFDHISKNSLYKISDLLYKHKEEIADHLQKQERDLFNLGEHII